MSRALHKIRKPEQDLHAKILQEIDTSFSGNQPVANFVNSILTGGEKVRLIRRLIIAQLVLRGYTYFEINEVMQVSPNTFSKIRRWTLEQIPEYAAVTSVAGKQKIERSNWPDTYSYEWLKKKYPAHFLLFNLSEHIFKKLKQK